MKRKNSPGCKCCGCVADATHVCVCACVNKFPKTLYVGDDNGTHPLIWSPVGQVWQNTGLTQPSVDVWTKSCTHSTTSLNYQIRLSFQCPTGAGTHPTGYWQLTVGWQATSCSFVIYYSNDTGLGGPFSVQAQQLVDGFTCDIDSGLSFTIPATSSTGGLATPGGGGSMVVMP